LEPKIFGGPAGHMEFAGDYTEVADKVAVELKHGQQRDVTVFE